MPINIVDGDKTMSITIQVYRSGKNFVANCPEFDIYSMARTKQQAVARIKKVWSFYVNSAEELGISFLELTGLLNNKVINEQETYRYN